MGFCPRPCPGLLQPAPPLVHVCSDAAQLIPVPRVGLLICEFLTDVHSQSSSVQDILLLLHKKKTSVHPKPLRSTSPSADHEPEQKKVTIHPCCVVNKKVMHRMYTLCWRRAEWIVSIWAPCTWNFNDGGKKIIHSIRIYHTQGVCKSVLFCGISNPRKKCRRADVDEIQNSD